MYLVSLTENVEMIENSRPDWLLQFYEHCHKYLQVIITCTLENEDRSLSFLSIGLTLHCGSGGRSPPMFKVIVTVATTFQLC